MRCRILGLIVTLTLRVLVTPLAVDAQAPVKAARIGWLRSTPETPEFRRILDAFTQELRDHGYSVGQNVTIAVRSQTEPATPLSALMGELLQFQADVIVKYQTKSFLTQCWYNTSSTSNRFSWRIPHDLMR